LELRLAFHHCRAPLQNGQLHNRAQKAIKEWRGKNPMGLDQEQQSEAGTRWFGFCLRPGFTIVPNAVTDNPYGTLKSPKAFCQYITGDVPQKIVLGNTVGDT
jgi:hypothetical protein